MGLPDIAISARGVGSVKSSIKKSPPSLVGLCLWLLGKTMLDISNKSVLPSSIGIPCLIYRRSALTLNPDGDRHEKTTITTTDCICICAS